MKKFMIFILALLVSTSVAKAVEMNIYPLPSVFSSKNISSQEFKTTLSENREEFINEYLNKFDSYFPNINKEISNKTMYKTFVSYVHVPRASKYVVKKSDLLMDIYLPITMSINFVNIATGEILYSYQITNYYKYQTKPAEQERTNNICNYFKQNYKETLDELIKQAQQDFKPFDITAKIIDSYKNTFILDKGQSSGVVKGDLLTDENINQVSVIYSDLNYSVAEKILGNPSINGNFSKFSNNSVTQIKKPKIFFINDFNSEMLYNIFSSELGSEAKFTLMTNDKTYYDMQSALESLNIEFNNNNLKTKASPDYFLKLYINKPAYANYKSNKSYVSTDKYAMLASAVIFDKSGRVVYGSCTDDSIVEEVACDIKLSKEAYYEILSKNILNKLAENMRKDIQFKDVKFKIKKIDNQYLKLADSNGFLRKGNILTVYKKIRTEKKGQKILVPTWDYKVIKTGSGVAECKIGRPHLDNINPPSKRDIVKATTMTRSANKAKMFNYIPENIEVEGNQVHLKSFEKMAFSALASSLKMPIAMNPNDFQDQIQEINTLGFKDKIEIPENPSELSIKAVYRINLKSEKFINSVKQQKYEIIVGIVSKKGDEILKKDGMKQEITITVPREDNEGMIEFELMKYIYPLIQELGAKF